MRISNVMLVHGAWIDGFCWSKVIERSTQGFIWLDRDGFGCYFAPDLDPAQARILAAVQKPIAASNLLGDEPCGELAWQLLPSWYLVTEQDHMCAPATQRLMAQRAGASVSSVAGAHIAMLTHSDEVVALIITAAQKL